MCGIVGYVGTKLSEPILINGLKRLEYRGYDSAGIALLDKKIHITKTKGKVSVLENKLNQTEDIKKIQSNIGIGHTRWATHGEPSDKNAHPILSNSGKIAMVHNGIIENYTTLKTKLLEEGYSFQSDTDSEVLVNLIESILLKRKCSLEEAVLIALKLVAGTYVIVLLDQDRPDRLIAARNGSPLVIGVGRQEHILASDATPIAEYTDNVVYVNDHELVIVSRDEIIMRNFNNVEIIPDIQKLDIEINQIEKGGYPFFMLKEIHEQPISIGNCMRGRISNHFDEIKFGGLKNIEDKLRDKKRVVFIACGTPLNAANIASYNFETYAKMQTHIEYASEFNYRENMLTKDDLVIVISQSGETIDTLMSVKKAKKSDALVLGVVNVVGSSIAREVEAGCYCHAGPEIGVASTKAFTSQVLILNLICLYIAKIKNIIDQEKFKFLVQSISDLPKQIKKVLSNNDEIENISNKYSKVNNFMFVGRGVHFPVAMEGALKLKEISYVNAQGYPSGELKHGPMALIDKDTITIGIIGEDKWKEKTLSNLQEIKARQGRVILISPQKDIATKQIADDLILIPEVDDMISPILSVIPLQLFAYYMGTSLGLDVDKPRNLAKSVTVE